MKCRYALLLLMLLVWGPGVMASSIAASLTETSSNNNTFNFNLVGSLLNGQPGEVLTGATLTYTSGDGQVHTDNLTVSGTTFQDSTSFSYSGAGHYTADVTGTITANYTTTSTSWQTVDQYGWITQYAWESVQTGTQSVCDDWFIICWCWESVPVYSQEYVAIGQSWGVTGTTQQQVTTTQTQQETLNVSTSTSAQVISEPSTLMLLLVGLFGVLLNSVERQRQNVAAESLYAATVKR
jgi:hypothetical protein